MEKKITRRKCIASGKIRMLTSTAKRIQDKKMPKGDVLAMGEMSGIMAAKTPQIYYRYVIR
ncbi:MAG: cyclic pyranopterin monophosphate synthase MoaC [Bacteriovoracaceae bacterium]